MFPQTYFMLMLQMCINEMSYSIQLHMDLPSDISP